MNEISLSAILAVIVAATPDAALQELVTWRQSLPDEQQDRVPAVTLYLASSRQLTAVPVAIERSADGKAALRLIQIEGRKSELDVLHVNLDAVEAVIIHHNEHSLRHFAPSAELSARPVPSDFQIKRGLEETSKAIHEATGEGVAVTLDDAWPESDLGKRLALHVAEQLTPALRAIAADEMGKAALKEKVRAVRLQPISESGPSVKIENGTLSIGIDVREGEMTLPDEEALKKAVENAL